MVQPVAPPGFFSLRLPARISFADFLRGAGLNMLLVIASGVLASFAFPPHEIWWLSWFSLVPLLVALRRTAVLRASGRLALLFGMVFLACTLTWLCAIFKTGALGVFMLASLPWMLFGLAYRALAGQTASWSSRCWAWVAVVLLAPVFWVAVEWIRCEGWYFQFSWAQFGFAMISARHGSALYPYIGVYGVTFLILLVNATVTEILLARARWTGKVIALAACGAVVVALSLYLSRPVDISQAPGSSFPVLMAQNESCDLRKMKSLTLPYASAKPQLIAWPEYAIYDYPLSDAKILAELQDTARTMHSTLVLGCKEHLPDTTPVDWLRHRAMMNTEGALFGNIALVLGPDGQVLGTYRKTHPIQFFSDGVPGQSFETIATPVGRLGLAICYDFDFASTNLRLVKNGAEVLVVPTFDSRDWGAVQHLQHDRIAQARAAEVGRWTIHVTTSGISQIINPAGQVTSAIQGEEPGTALGVAVPLRGLTWYVRVGYLLPYLCLVLSGIWLVVTLVVAISRKGKA